MCAVECNTTEHCVSYEYYDRQCRLFEEDKLSTTSTSGFFHCTKIGNTLFSHFSKTTLSSDPRKINMIALLIH